MIGTKRFCNISSAMLLLGLLSVPAFAQNVSLDTEGASGLVYGEGHSFFVTAPKGWVLDTHSGVDQGLVAVFYPKGSTWATSEATMYVNTRDKVEGTGLLDAFIDSDIARFKVEVPGVKISEGTSLKTKDGKTALVRNFTGGGSGNFETVAYLEESKVFVMIVLSARQLSARDRVLPGFRSLVNSYSFATDNVVLPQNGKPSAR